MGAPWYPTCHSDICHCILQGCYNGAPPLLDSLEFVLMIQLWYRCWLWIQYLWYVPIGKMLTTQGILEVCKLIYTKLVHYQNIFEWVWPPRSIKSQRYNFRALCRLMQTKHWRDSFQPPQTSFSIPPHITFPLSECKSMYEVQARRQLLYGHIWSCGFGQLITWH